MKKILIEEARGVKNPKIKRFFEQEISLSRPLKKEIFVKEAHGLRDPKIKGFSSKKSAEGGS